MSDAETAERIVDVLRGSDEPLSASGIQRRLAVRSRDVTAGVVGDVREELREEGRVEATDDLPTSYRLVDD